MENILDEFVDVKPEIEYPVDYPLPEIEVVASSLDIPTESQMVNRFCRLCLREIETLFPLMSRVQKILIPDMVAAVTGVNINFRDNLPKKVCIQCLVKLDYAYHIRKEFAERHQVLKNLAKTRICTLWECLKNYQKGVLATAETRSEQLLRENRDIIRMRLIKKEEQLANMTGEELVDVDLPGDKPAENAKEAAEIISDPEEDVVIMEEVVLEVEEAKQVDNEAQSTDEWESEERISEDTEKNTNSKITKILHHKLEINESDPDPNKCYICLETFSSVDDLELHLPQHMGMVPYQCEECKGTPVETKPFTTVIMMHRHVRMHAGTIKCPECPSRFYKRNNLASHLKRYHLQDPNAESTCETCGAKVKNRKALESHMHRHKAVDEGRYTCSFCAKKFATGSRLQRHERIHTNERPYGCRYCSKSFNNETTFRAHERTHTGERGYRCEECGKGFHTRNELNQHLDSIHKVVSSSNSARGNPASKDKYLLFDSPVKCSYEGCDFETTTRSKYYQHRAKHALSFHCSFCDKRFPTKQRLEMHEFVHTNVKQFCCDLCGKSFRYRISFSEHMAAHNNVRSYSCKICNISFVRDRNLKEHMKKHSDELKHACRICGKKFRYRADLSKHVRLHKAPKTVSKEEVDFDPDEMDAIAEEYEEESVMVEYLDE